MVPNELTGPLTFGVDPEVFLWDTQRHRPVPAHWYFVGSKKKPEPVLDGFIQIDGLAGEFNSPVFDDLLECFKWSQDYIRKLPKYLGIPNYIELRPTPVVNFLNKEWEDTPDDLKVLGCDPDYGVNGYFTHVWRNKSPNIPEKKRTGSGHIAVGFPKYLPNKKWNPQSAQTLKDCAAISYRTYDCTPWYLFQGDKEEERRKYYGGNSAFRPKSFGVEVRWPSNSWLEFKEDRLRAFAEGFTWGVTKAFTLKHRNPEVTL